VGALVDSEQKLISDSKKSRMNISDQLVKNAEDLASFQLRRQDKELR